MILQVMDMVFNEIKSTYFMRTPSILQYGGRGLTLPENRSYATGRLRAIELVLIIVRYVEHGLEFGLKLSTPHALSCR
jgi:hypothetical protein